MQHVTEEEVRNLLALFRPFAAAASDAAKNGSDTNGGGNGNTNGGGSSNTPPPFDAASAEVKRLAGYDDANFCVTARRLGGGGGVQKKFLLKVHTAATALPPLHAQNAAMLHVAAAVRSNQPIPLARGTTTTTLDGGDGYVAHVLIGGHPVRHPVRLLTWVDGAVMSSGSGEPGSPLVPAPELLRALGALAARLSAALADFEHPSMLDGSSSSSGGSNDAAAAAAAAAAADGGLRDWYMESAAATVRRKLPAVASTLGPRRVALAERAAAQLDAAVASASQSGGGGSPLPRQACHGDLNENNVLVSSDRRAVVGVIDWGDASRCWRATEVAIAATYMLLLAADDDGDAGSDDAAVSTSMTAAARHVIDGYLDAGGALTAAEAAVLPSLICGRIALSLINGATAAAAAPENAEYTLRTQRPGWRALEVFVGGGGGGMDGALSALFPERLLRGLNAAASV